MLKTMSDIWKLNIKVKEVEANENCDRTLRTKKQLNNILNPALFDEQIKQLYMVS
jgi:hypothetical protein